MIKPSLAIALGAALLALAATCVDEETANAGGDGPTTTVACVSCHQADYDGTSAPAHASGGIGTDCAGCHVNSHWVPAAGYAHPSSFPLVGKHAQVPCAGCHAVDPKPSTQCVGCHEDDWKQTNNPSHGGAGIGLLCGDCHSEEGWKPALLPQHESAFPLESGAKHRDIACATCHLDGGDYKHFSCFNGCHAKSETDKEHKGEVNGYVYDSAACLKCHPQGKA